MSKELEALNELIENHVCVFDEKDINDVERLTNILRKALTPPTAEKVCKALGETLKRELEYVYEKLPSVVWDDQSLIWIIEKLQKEFKKDFEEQTEQGEKMNKDTENAIIENAINYFKYRTSFETSVFETTQFQTIIKTLTPPTAEEVCEALGKHYKLEEFESVLYDENFSYFVLNRLKEKGNIVFLIKNKIKINDYLPPHLITLIGRFYESVVE